MALPISPSLGVILKDQWFAAHEKGALVGEADLFLGLIEKPNQEVSALLAVSGVSHEEARLYAQSWRENEVLKPGQKVDLSRSTNDVMFLAQRETEHGGSLSVEPQHLFIACVSHRRGPHLGEVLRPLGLDAAQLRQHLRGLNQSEAPYPRGNPLNDLTVGAKRVVEAAHAEMRASYCGRISVAHLLLALLRDEEIAEIIEKAGCDAEDLRKRARESIKSDGEIAMHQKRFSPGAKHAIERASRAAKLAGHKYIGCGHLLLGLLPQAETMGEKWQARGRKLDSVEGLWTAKEALIIRRTLRGEAKLFEKGSLDSALLPPQQKGFLSFLASLFWLPVLLAPASMQRTFHGSFLLVAESLVLFLMAIAVGQAVFLRQWAHTKIPRLAILFGWMIGMGMGIFVALINGLFAT